MPTTTAITPTRNSEMDVNAELQHTSAALDRPTLYPSPYLVMGMHGYTKHYYAGTNLCASREQSQACLSYAETKQSVRSNRICAKTGGGFGESITRSFPDLQATADSLFSQSRENIRCRELLQNNMECVVSYGHVPDAEMNVHLYEMPSHFRSDAEIHLGEFHSVVEWCEHEFFEEDDVFFYHSDHLGSASWITDAHGYAVQHLQYLPFGEPFVDQHPAGYQERYTFTGKEKDEETGYGYFGARYMDHELMTMWLSVDPMSDKYPSISPYNYCMWNPIRLVDPNGMDTVVFDGAGNFSNRIKASGKHIGRVLDKNGNKRFDFEFVCQQDADRCCSPGSPEEVDIRFRDRLSHGKDCPAEEQSPIYQIEFVWQKEIISQLKESGACDKSFFPRWGYAFSESDGGKIDFDDINRRNGNWNDHTLYIPMVPGKKYAHNASNLGNFLWGAAMYKMGINIKDAIIGANLHALWSHWELDSSDDRLSILLGYNYSIKQSRAR